MLGEMEMPQRPKGKAVKLAEKFGIM